MTSSTVHEAWGDVAAEHPVTLWHNHVPATAVAQSDMEGAFLGALIPLPPSAPHSRDCWMTFTHQLAATLPILDAARLERGLFGVALVDTAHIGEAIIVTRLDQDEPVSAVPSPFQGYLRIGDSERGWRVEYCDSRGHAQAAADISAHGEAWGPFPI